MPRPLLVLSLQGILTATLALVMATGRLLVGKTTFSSTAPIAAAKTGKAKFVLLVYNDDIPATGPMQQIKVDTAWLGNIRAKRVANGEYLHANDWDIVYHTMKQYVLHKRATSELQGHFSIHFPAHATNLKAHATIVEAPGLALPTSLQHHFFKLKNASTQLELL